MDDEPRRRVPRYEYQGYGDYRPPIPVEDGIRARSRRGTIGETWWSRRFLAALESYYGTTESRLERGRRYARAGQTIELHLEPGQVRALVQGSRPKPYAVTINVRVLGDSAWRRIESAMASRVVFLARLLAGEMPDEIEEAFADVDLSLFPTRRGDLVTKCSCPDTANPCKHIAAVFYLLAESFDVDPFRMFEWRGRDRASLVAELRALRPATPAAAARRPGETAPDAEARDATGFDVDRFWNGGPGWTEIRIEQRPAGPPDALLRDMPAETVAVLGPDAASVLRPLYAAAARAARGRLDPTADSGRTPSRRSPPRR